MKHDAMGNVEEMLQCTSKGSEEEDCKLVNMENEEKLALQMFYEEEHACDTFVSPHTHCVF